MDKDNKKYLTNNRERFFTLKNYNNVVKKLKIDKNQKNFELNPLDDSIFRLTFGEKGCELQLKYLLNAIFKEKGYPEINKLEIFENTKQKSGKYLGKETILDIRGKIDNGTIINIELQRRNKRYFELRVIYYIAGEIRDFLKSGEGYDNIPPLVVFLITDYEMNDFKNYHHVYKIKDEYNQLFSDKFRIHTVELPKLFKEKIDLNNDLHLFALFFNPYTSKETMKIIMEKNEGIKMANEQMTKVLEDKETLRNLRMEFIAELDYNTDMKDAERKGIEKGVMKTAKNFLKSGLSVEFVSENTGIPIDKLEKLI